MYKFLISKKLGDIRKVRNYIRNVFKLQWDLYKGKPITRKFRFTHEMYEVFTDQAYDKQSSLYV